ncbi:hypothetical protein CANCADRAFT_32742 [Tortispora caseinolytica NRRL Y-17796]|uniref:Aminoacyl-transfer RNA synthetases class-II family profile domain-containing protein n=1 Tax=Tortispora caseinolytica NRRL Y-17796 TaxID=767744 RepID=A0A1E4TCM6_9ASCO|nr:hypothetical protein CANCADRAFT_32742 [Tortispora caseinolytica NRRL Y-17796]
MLKVFSRPSVRAYSTLHTKPIKSQTVSRSYPPSLDVEQLYPRFPRASYKPINEILNSWDRLSAAADTVRTYGRVARVRDNGGLIFIDLQHLNASIQVMMSVRDLENSPDQASLNAKYLKPGDSIEVEGQLVCSSTSVRSIKPSRDVRFLSVAQNIPSILRLKKDQLVSNRVLEYKLRPELKDHLVARALIIKQIRNFLDSKSFIEVNTPILSSAASGAVASPFITTSRFIRKKNKQLQLRIAPELWLKRLITSGLDRIYELGPCFRNEGIDPTHNPEFTTCEFYTSFSQIHDLVQLTQNLLTSFFDIPELEPYLKEAPASLREKDFQIIDFVPYVEQKIGTSLPKLSSNNSTLVTDLISIFEQNNIALPASKTAPALLETLAEIYIEPACIKPTFVMNHPEILSPLAKSFTSPEGHVLSPRFELYINGKELCNAYEEENSPDEQLRKFQEQLDNKLIEYDLPVIDQDYIQSLRLGMPPTAGWGIGIDRLCMQLLGLQNIHDVLPFGGLNQTLSQ